ncbi:fibrous sheath-interacting protein 2-like [Aotus nancymaae]|uniref:fibrous sheath-interacting protein 2-like n=1 Tax=Aotus nancymaae TaxID=37293 RepID=UPI0030FF3C93
MQYLQICLIKLNLKREALKLIDRPTYGSLPGGAESDSFLEDDAYTEKKIMDDRSLQREEMKTLSLKQWALEKTLRKIEVKLKEPNADLSGELDINRIVQKAQEHAINMIPESEEEQLDQVSSEEEYPIKIVPYVGKKPVKIDPKIISEHLAVTSTKTQPLKKLKQECLKRTGLSIAELRKASISGRNYSSESPNLENRKRERCASLDKTGRLDVKPLEDVGRNSFENIRKPDITRVELLKDVQSKNDLIVRLVAHDIDRVDLKNEELDSDEDEVVLRETVAEEGFKVFKGQVKEVKKPEENKVSPKSTRSTSRLKKLLSLFNCCCQTTGSTEATSNQVIECF